MNLTLNTTCFLHCNYQEYPQFSDYRKNINPLLHSVVLGTTFGKNFNLEIRRDPSYSKFLMSASSMSQKTTGANDDDRSLSWVIFQKSTANKIQAAKVKIIYRCSLKRSSISML